MKKISVIGTGVIGSGWIIRFLAHDKKVTAYDKDLKLKKRIIEEIKRTWPYVKKLFNKKKIKLKNFRYVTSLKEALKDADFIQECAPENYKLKIKFKKFSFFYFNRTNIERCRFYSRMCNRKLFIKN